MKFVLLSRHFACGQAASRKIKAVTPAQANQTHNRRFKNICDFQEICLFAVVAVAFQGKSVKENTPNSEK